MSQPHPDAPPESTPDAATDARDAPDLAFVRTMWAEDGASRALGMEVLDVDLVDGLGRAVVRMPITEAMVNGHAICHGGYLFTLCDSAFALACNAKGEPTVAAGCDIDFVAPARLGDVAVATARERTSYGRNGITDVELVREGDGTLLAHFRGRSRTLRRRT